MHGPHIVEATRMRRLNPFLSTSDSEDDDAIFDEHHHVPAADDHDQSWAAVDPLPEHGKDTLGVFSGERLARSVQAPHLT